MTDMTGLQVCRYCKTACSGLSPPVKSESFPRGRSERVFCNGAVDGAVVLFQNGRRAACAEGSRAMRVRAAACVYVCV